MLQFVLGIAHSPQAAKGLEIAFVAMLLFAAIEAVIMVIKTNEIVSSL